MKVTFDWLESYVNFNYSPQELVERLTMLGLEVDSVEKQARNFNRIVVGKVLHKERLDNSNRLWACQVDVGNQQLSIVCGAPNVETGQKVAVATEGAVLTNAQMIQKTSIRGYESQGMLCSAAELGIASKSDAILVLDDAVVVGSNLSQVFGAGETIIDIDVTPNRPDCLGVLGLAREIAAVAQSALRKPEVAIAEAGRSISDLITIEIHDKQKCPRYTARHIGNVTIMPSPLWLIQKLEAVGIRSINNVVDVTNYVMMETGQPLHAFDYDLLRGQKIVVKTARPGDQFKTLDEKQHTLNEECLMICDAENAVAIGGIMGGLNSEVSDDTRNILLECAYFNPVNIRRTSKHLEITTESSKRFERGTDPNGLIYALDRAAALIAELSGGVVARGIIDAYPDEITPRRITLRPQRVRQLLGIDVSAEAVTDTLSRLEFQVKQNRNFEVEVPTFRPDVSREADLIEEIARVYGYDNIPADTQAVIQQLESKDELEAFHSTVRDILVSSGFSEVLTYCMVSQKNAELFRQGKTALKLKNPLSEDFTHLRTSLIPGLLDVARWNINRKSTNLRFFEKGNVFSSTVGGSESTVENAYLAGLITGHAGEDTWLSKAEEVSFYHLKGLVETFLSRLGAEDWSLVPCHGDFTDEQTSGIYIDQNRIGFLGRLNQRLLQKFEIEQSVFVFEMALDPLRKKVNWRRVYTPIPRYPAITRDLALVIDETIDAREICHAIEKRGGENLKSVNIFDVYTGEQVPAGRKSLALKLNFYSLERTLTEDEVDGQIKTVLEELIKKFDARLRA
ncbi:MAG: phenylalanine--tRNA ligase subunit beta [bacterium]